LDVFGRYPKATIRPSAKRPQLGTGSVNENPIGLQRRWGLLVVKSDRRGPRPHRALLQALEPCAIRIPGVNHSAALQHRGELQCFPAGTCAEIQESIARPSFHESAEHLTTLVLNLEKASLMGMESENVWSRCLNVKGILGKQSGSSLDTFGSKLSRQILSGNSERIRSQRHGPGQVESVRERV
jgi:hypothetical protein